MLAFGCLPVASAVARARCVRPAGALPPTRASPAATFSPTQGLPRCQQRLGAPTLQRACASGSISPHPLGSSNTSARLCSAALPAGPGPVRLRLLGRPLLPLPLRPQPLAHIPPQRIQQHRLGLSCLVRGAPGGAPATSARFTSNPGTPSGHPRHLACGGTAAPGGQGCNARASPAPGQQARPRA